MSSRRQRRTAAAAAIVVMVALAAAGAGANANGDPAPSATPGASELSRTRSVGSPVLSDSAAGAHVEMASAEARPGNAAADQRVPTPAELAAFRRQTEAPYSQLVTGQFTGTTDQIIQWAAWKWGVDENLVRAVATMESDWRQGFVGDHRRSYGIMQIKRTAAGDNQGWPGTYPLSRESTAFNLDFWGRAFRSCYDGRDRFLVREGLGYEPGDAWGCVGLWNSGEWHDATAEAYIAHVQRILSTRGWPGATGRPPLVP